MQLLAQHRLVFRFLLPPVPQPVYERRDWVLAPDNCDQNRREDNDQRYYKDYP